MDSPIRITAQPLDYNPEACKFTVDQPILPRGFARFTDASRAQASPLAERLFAVAGVVGVDLSGDTITVTKSSADNWRAIGPLIGAAIRAHLQSGQPSILPEALDQLPSEDKLRARVQLILDEQINPSIASHGGTITLIDVQKNRLFIKMGGGCQGCASANVTLREGVEKAIREQVPEVGEILDISDHAAGTNPYYART